jgi:hypothetical protein
VKRIDWSYQQTFFDKPIQNPHRREQVHDIAVNIIAVVIVALIAAGIIWLMVEALP